MYVNLFHHYNGYHFSACQGFCLISWKTKFKEHLSMAASKYQICNVENNGQTVIDQYEQILIDQRALCFMKDCF